MGKTGQIARGFERRRYPGMYRFDWTQRQGARGTDMYFETIDEITAIFIYSKLIKPQTPGDEGDYRDLRATFEGKPFDPSVSPWPRLPRIS